MRVVEFFLTTMPLSKPILMASMAIGSHQDGGQPLRQTRVSVGRGSHRFDRSLQPLQRRACEGWRGAVTALLCYTHTSILKRLALSPYYSTRPHG
ncbi:hypothetical protein E2C01_076471 [Portunus trituberculatus]|uniref:Uncharacterized protein n=1 Tax=Portunus trituberculatus TaxID=210409 RepID=A0A5B7IIM3_PORTR|nr:hypothetical protein [Portunus trituberculatus]